MTRKMQIFYTTIIFELIVLLFAMFKQVIFTSENLTSIIQVTLLFGIVLAGANVGEWFMKTKLGNTENKA